MLPIIVEKEFSVEIECLPEDNQIHGNLIDSGDYDFDRQCEEKVIHQLESSNEWAWCCVRVIVTHLPTGTEGDDYLGECSYASETDFIANSGYFDDMVNKAILDCMHKMTDSGRYQAHLAIAV